MAGAGGTVLVTGASGLLGSNIARLAAARGDRVRGLVRGDADAAVLAALGVEPCLGDVTDPASLGRAMRGVTRVIHSAALIGGTWSTSAAAEFEAVNFQGTANVLDAGAREGAGRTVLISTFALLDPAFTVTEHSPLIAPTAATSPYQKAKLASYYDAMQRAVRGLDVAFVFPARCTGRAPSLPVRCSRPCSPARC